MTDATHSPSRAFVLGLDGVPWPLIRDWIADDELPNFGRLVDEGAAGSLESTIQATTPLAWPAIATGTSPDKHGIYGFRKLTSSYTPQMYTSGDLCRPTLWDILSPSLVGNVPMTYPAQHLDGKLFTGMVTPELDDQFSYPSDLRDELEARVPDYEIGLDWNDYAGREEALFDDITDLVRKRREAMRLLMETEDWRLFFFVYTAPDRLQHLIWDESVLLEHYRQLDDILGEVLDYVQRLGATLYVVSDHGFGPVSQFVAINGVLEDAGLLARGEESGTQSMFSSLGLSRDRVTELLSAVGVSGRAIVETVPEPLLRRVGKQLPGDDVLFDVDHAETRMFGHDFGSLYVNDTDRFVDGTVDSSERESVKATAKATLSDVTDPVTGEPALTVHDGDDLFPTDDQSPDLVVEGKPEYETVTTLTDDVFTDTGTKAASHRSDGIVLAWGPNIEAGSTPDDATVYDVAPTLLHHLGEPVPANADGRVLSEIFEPGSDPAERDPESTVYESHGAGETTEDEDFDNVKERLSGLGYIE